MYDDPTEPEEVNEPARPTAAIRVKIENWDLNSIEGRIAATLKEQMAARLEKLFEDTIEDRVRELVDTAAHDRIRDAVAEVLAEGWQETNRYGESMGQRLTLKDRISRMISRQPQGQYDREFSVEQVARDVIDTALRGEFGKEIEAAKKRFKEMIDGRVMASWLEAVKRALGIR